MNSALFIHRCNHCLDQCASFAVMHSSLVDPAARVSHHSCCLCVLTEAGKLSLPSACSSSHPLSFSHSLSLSCINVDRLLHHRSSSAASDLSCFLLQLLLVAAASLPLWTAARHHSCLHPLHTHSATMADFLASLRKDPAALKSIKPNAAVLRDVFNAIPEEERRGVTMPTSGLKIWLENWAIERQRIAAEGGSSSTEEATSPAAAAAPAANANAAPSQSQQQTSISSHSAPASASVAGPSANIFDRMLSHMQDRPATAASSSSSSSAANTAAAGGITVGRRGSNSAINAAEPPQSPQRTNMFDFSSSSQQQQQQLQQQQPHTPLSARASPIAIGLSSPSRATYASPAHHHSSSSSHSSADLLPLSASKCPQCRRKDIQIKKLEALVNNLLDQLDSINMETRGDLTLIMREHAATLSGNS